MSHKLIGIAIFHGLGDCVNATTMLRPIKQAYPKAAIHWITAEAYAGVVRNNPLVDKVITVPGNVWAADAKYPEFAKKYKCLVQPAPYRHPPAPDNTLLGSFKDRIKRFTKKPAQVFEPLLYVTREEKLRVNEWLADKKITKYVMLESLFTSSQSFWNPEYTKLALKVLNNKGYTVLLTHRNDAKLGEYNKLCRTYCLDFSYRVMPHFYNKSSGFIGVSSGITCVTHTHQCYKDIPHLEFVGGEHWCTRHYKKQKKLISFNKKPAHVRELIESHIPAL